VALRREGGQDVTRDSRIDPQPGDRVRAVHCQECGAGITRKVAGRVLGDVLYRVEGIDPEGLPARGCTLKSWRSWCSRNKAVEVKK
jgi:hypothetical protein